MRITKNVFGPATSCIKCKSEKAALRKADELEAKGYTIFLNYWIIQAEKDGESIRILF